MARTGDPGKNMTARKVEEAERERKAVAAMLRGLTFEQAAEAVGYADRSSARKAVMRVLARTAADIKEKADELRALEVARLDRALVEITAYAFHPATSPDTRLKYLEALNRNVRTRAMILGLNAPIQHEVITHDALDREIANLTTKLGVDPFTIDGEVLGPILGTALAIGAGEAAQADDPAGAEAPGG